MTMPALRIDPTSARADRVSNAFRVTGHYLRNETTKPLPSVVETPWSCTPCDLESLTDCTCRWPVNDAAPWRFCGVATNSDGPYCALHARLASGGPAPTPDRLILALKGLV